MSAAVSIAFAWLAFALCFRAEAQPAAGRVELTWIAPPDCPARESVLSEITRVLGPSPEPRGPATARAQVTRSDQGQWHAALSVDARGAQTERAFDAESCEAIVSATALIVAVAVEGRLPQAAAAPPGASPAPPTPPPQTQALLPVPPRQPASPSQLDIGAAGVIDVGTLPKNVAEGGELVAGWTKRVSRWQLRAFASGALFGSQGKTDSNGNGGSLALLTVTARSCASLWVGPVDAGPCLGVELDYMWAESGLGGSTFRSYHGGVAWPAVLGSLWAAVHFSRQVGLFVLVDGVVKPTPPPELFVQIANSSTQDPVYQAPQKIGARVGLGLELRFF